MPYGKPLMDNSLTMVVVMCHCLIGENFHKVAFHMITHDCFVLWKWELPHVKLSFTLNGEFSYKGSGHVSLSYRKDFSKSSFSHGNIWVVRFVRVRTTTCQAFFHQDSIFRVLVHVSILRFGQFWRHLTL